ncbi:MAG: BspA family leucine-rich repeat surface protein, partial [Prevotella sp.]|nr:BspA family leucine-rich repeat surface protein [Prevotella sp.]
MKRLQLFLMTLLMLLGSTSLRAAEMYAVLNNNTLTFYYDNSKSSRTGTKYSMNKTGNAPSWYNNTSITGVVFDASFAGARPTTCYGWFYGLEGLKTITGIGNLNTSNVESMYSMFNK